MNTAHPPGPKGHPIQGCLPEFRRDPLAFLQHAATYGDIASFRVGPVRVYLLNDPGAIHAVLVEHPLDFHKTPVLKRTTRYSLGNGLLTSEGEFHRQQRARIQPAFHHQRIAGYAEIMARHTDRMLARWQNGDEIDAAQEMMKLALGIVSESLFGAEVGDQAEEIGRAITFGVETVGERLRAPLPALPEWVPTRKQRRRLAARAFIRRTVMGMIEARRDDPVDRPDLLSMLISAGDGEMSAQQIMDEAITLFVAGHETTALALSWALYLLAQHPAAEARVRSGYAAYTDAVIKETMRLYPPAWVIGRTPATRVAAPPAPVAICGWPIPPRSAVIISPYVLHRDPRWYPEPDRFLPERWLPDESGEPLEKRIPRYAYLPFGGGPRVCIGQGFAMLELQVALPRIVQGARLELLPGQDVRPDPLVTLRPKGGIRMRVARLS